MANITIQEVRQKYPQYEALSDQDLADKLHAKYYSDLPKEDFYSRIGFNSNPESKLMGLAKKAFSSKEEGLISPFGLAQDVAVGLGNAGQNVAHYFGSKAPQVDIQETLGRENPNHFIQGVAEYTPYAALARLLRPGIIPQLAAGAAYGGISAKAGEREGGAAQGALINALTHGAFKGLEKLSPSKLLRGNLSPQELQGNLETTAGTPTGLGDVIGSPFLKRQYENILSKIPFSGANEKLQQAGQAVHGKGQNILSEMLGTGSPENITDQLSETLMNQFKEHQAAKTALYNDVDQLAQKSGFAPKVSGFAEKAKDYAEALKDMDLLKYEPEYGRMFNKLKNYVEAPESITLKEANLLKGKLGEYANAAKRSPEPAQRHMAKVYGDLASALKGDITSSIESSGNKTLGKAYKSAEENFAKNFSPFLDKDIYKFIGGRQDPDLLVQSFLKSGRSKAADRENLLSKLTSKLPEEQKGLLGYAYFSRALDKEGNLNPGKLSTLINDLGKNQFKALVENPELRKQLANYNKLYKMNTKGVNIMENPATGQQNLDALSVGLGHAVSGLLGGAAGGPLGALAGVVAPGLAARPLVHMLTSPSVREALVKAMIENRGINLPVQPGQAALQSLMKQGQQ